MLCGICGQALIDGVHHEVSGDFFCPDCYKARFALCENCNEEFSLDDAQDGDRYCRTCSDELFVNCHDCGGVVSVDDCQTSRDGESYCESCYDDRYTHCEHCEEELRRNCAYSHEGNEYCESCYEDIFFTCDTCGETFSIDDCYATDDGRYCESCHENRRAEEGEWDTGYFSPSDTFDEMGSTRAFGVELETATCPDHYTLREDTIFGCKPDGSIGGMEFVSPILSSDKGLMAIREFCRQARNFTVDSHCGYHAHFDLRETTLAQRKAIVYAYALTAEVWAAMVPSTRRTNHYCSKIEWLPEAIRAIKTDQEFRRFCGLYSRYTWLNIAAYNQHCTLEIRNHPATLSADKIVNWVKAHSRFIDAVASMRLCDIKSMFAGSIEQQFRAVCVLWQSAELADYYYNRASEFGTELRLKEVA